MMQAERSAGVKASQRCIFLAISIRFSCVTGTRLDGPVVPEVRKIAAQDCAVTSPGDFGLRMGRTCSSATSSKEATAFLTLKSAKSSPAAFTQSGMTPSPGRTNASRRTRFSSACRSAAGRFGLKGTTVAAQQMATLSNAASGPR